MPPLQVATQACLAGIVRELKDKAVSKTLDTVFPGGARSFAAHALATAHSYRRHF